MSADQIFSRLELAQVVMEVRKHKTTVKLRDAWVYKLDRDHWEFHYEGFYWHGSADNAADARAKGWSAWLHYENRAVPCNCGHVGLLHGTTSGVCTDCDCTEFVKAGAK